ncbi:MAG: serine/threonine-protein phosphatase, partial [Clostridia bacterium]|nr:serine/threonine-protein phosphatase [Clostridia bacterium]
AVAEGEYITFIGPGEELRCEQDWSGPYIEASLASDVGRKRKNNEDSCLLCVPRDEFGAEWRGHLFAVADGMGGASAGERASFLTLQCLAEKYFDESLKGMAPAVLKAAIDHANRAVFAEAEGNPVYEGMGTTISAMAIMGNWAYVGQVGDSRLYLVREGIGIRQITEDHSLVAEQMRNGLLNEEEARNHSLKNLITRDTRHDRRLVVPQEPAQLSGVDPHGPYGDSKRRDFRARHRAAACFAVLIPLVYLVHQVGRSLYGLT